MSKAVILVVEDDADIQELLSYNLGKEGYTVVTAATGEQGLFQAGRANPDLVLLDIMLPGADGLSVLRSLKQDEKTRNVPVLMMTAKSEDSDVITGLELGADDYVTKPFAVKVLIARIRTALRRTAAPVATDPDEKPIIEMHGILIDPARHEVRCGEEVIDLSATEFAVLEHLARHPGWVFSREQIIDSIRGKNYPVTERSVDVQILGLRKKLGNYGDYVQTVRGIGYRMAAEKDDQP
jgi:two-component system, OmpR family, alkaline phosphatase synthesis response regulator PhoP